MLEGSLFMTKPFPHASKPYSRHCSSKLVMQVCSPVTVGSYHHLISQTIWVRLAVEDEKEECNIIEVDTLI